MGMHYLFSFLGTNAGQDLDNFLFSEIGVKLCQHFHNYFRPVFRCGFSLLIILALMGDSFGILAMELTVKCIKG
jgi:hypothetical protein